MLVKTIEEIDSFPLVGVPLLREFVLLNRFCNKDTKKFLQNKYHNPPNKGLSVMRDSIYGNPYQIGSNPDVNKYIERQESVSKYILSLLINAEAIIEIKKLNNNNIFCCCKPALCHGEILTFIANDFSNFKINFYNLIEEIRHYQITNYYIVPIKIYQDLLTTYNSIKHLK